MAWSHLPHQQKATLLLVRRTFVVRKNLCETEMCKSPLAARGASSEASWGRKRKEACFIFHWILIVFTGVFEILIACPFQPFGKLIQHPPTPHCNPQLLLR